MKNKIPFAQSVVKTAKLVDIKGVNKEKSTLYFIFKFYTNFTPD